MSEDSLGDRMKAYEGVTRGYLVPRMPAILRVDGRAFHSYTKDCEKPFDYLMMAAMNKTAIALLSEISTAKLAYVQSDEISILLNDYETLATQQWFGGNIQKIVSIAASIAAVKMTLESQKFHPKCLDDMMAYGPISCEFDARVFNVPRSDVNNYFVWRQQDWRRNSLQMLARSLYSHKQLEGKNAAAMHEMIHAKGGNWAALPSHAKDGRIIEKRQVSFAIPAGPKKGEIAFKSEWHVNPETDDFHKIWLLVENKLGEAL